MSRRVHAPGSPKAGGVRPRFSSAAFAGAAASMARRFPVRERGTHPLGGTSGPSAERGEGLLGCAVVLLVAVVFGFVSFKVIPVYIDSMNFDEDLAREASRAGASFWADEKIRDDVRKMADFREFRIEPDGLVITRSPSVPPEVRIEVRYRADVVFPGYTRVFRFHSKASSLVGSF